MRANADSFYQDTDLLLLIIVDVTEIMVKRVTKASPTMLAY